MRWTAEAWRHCLHEYLGGIVRGNRSKKATVVSAVLAALEQRLDLAVIAQE